MSPQEPIRSHVHGWHSLTLGDGIDAQAPTATIQQAYTALELATNLPADCAVFSHYDLRVNVVTVYFSPSALQLARAFGAEPCDPPEKNEGFSLLIGARDKVWGLLFPDHGM